MSQISREKSPSISLNYRFRTVCYHIVQRYYCSKKANLSEIPKEKGLQH